MRIEKNHLYVVSPYVFVYTIFPMPNKNKTAKSPIRVFAAASFLNDLGSDIIYPVWPLFVTTVLKANMAVLGFLDGLGEALVSLSQAASGYLSDRIKKRKVFIWTGYLCGALSRVGYALSSVWLHLVPFRILDRAGKIRSTPRDAMVADLSTEKTRGKHFGILRAMDHLGAVFGILTCIVLIRFLGYRILFAVAALPSLVSAFLVFTLIKEKKTGKVEVYKGIAFKDIDRNFRLFLLLSSLFALGAFSYSFLLIYAKLSGFKAVFIPVLYLIFTAAASLCAYPFGKLSDKIGRKPVLMLSFLLWCGVCLGVIFGQSASLVFIVFILFGVHKGALEPVQRTFVCELSPKEFRASSLGGFQMITGLCALPASLLAGILWEGIGMNAAFVFSLLLTLASAFMLLFVRKDRAKHPED